MITLDPDDNTSRQEDDDHLPPWLAGPGIRTGIPAVGPRPIGPAYNPALGDDEEDRPTIGQRMAGAGRPMPYEPPQPTAPPVKIPFDPSKLPDFLRPPTPSQASVPAPPPSGERKLPAVPGVYGLSAVPGMFAPADASEGNVTPPPLPRLDFDPSKLPDVLRPRQITPAEVPVAPTGANNPDRVAAMKKLGQDMTPLDINAVDPKTGKPIYKMGTGQRVLSIIANALGTYGAAKTGHPFNPIDVSPNATNSRYANDERMRLGNVAKDQAQLEQEEKLDTSNERGYRDMLRQAYEGETGAARKETADARAALVESEKARNQAIADKNSANPSDQRTKDADAQGLTGQARKDYILTGKLPKDFASAGRQPTELEMWRDAFVRDNKRQPTADEIANRKNRTDTKADQITKDRDTALEKAEQKATQRIDKLSKENPYIADPAFPKLKGESADAYMERRKQAIYADLEKEKAAAVKDYQERAAQNANRGPARAAQPNAAASKPVSLDEAKDYLKRAGGNKDKARQLAKKDGRTF